MQNTHKEPFKPGQAVLIREIWQGQVWSARPEIVVQDTPELLGLFIPVGTIWKQPTKLNGGRVKPVERLNGSWFLTDVKWETTTGRLRLCIPGESYSVLIFWKDNYSNQDCFYINLEEPLYRTTRGFDYTDMLLDAIVEPDLKTWHWKDEDELAEAVALNQISKERARELYAEGERVAKMLQSGKSVFNGWEHWKPDPSWETPILPEGWDTI